MFIHRKPFIRDMRYIYDVFKTTHSTDIVIEGRVDIFKGVELVRVINLSNGLSIYCRIRKVHKKNRMIKVISRNVLSKNKLEQKILFNV